MLPHFSLPSSISVFSFSMNSCPIMFVVIHLFRFVWEELIHKEDSYAYFDQSQSSHIKLEN